ncbi:unnamed protein product [Notodromas monacha]|uniref:Transcription factor BTF3 n=1 Tax=Notodromas monacha TaxID=399045 RepID=A0A7R9GD22_9CRUS|nr:unnamed protein product [Notodromas monacha]CAG0918248.1 unnamed protein product [Notodromas monacha]
MWGAVAKSLDDQEFCSGEMGPHLQWWYTGLKKNPGYSRMPVYRVRWKTLLYVDVGVSNAQPFPKLCARSSSNACDIEKKLEDVPGPKPTLPFIGTNWQYWPLLGSYSKDQLHLAYLDQYKKYGVIHAEEFQWSRPFLKVCHPEDFEAVLRRQGKYPRRPINAAVKHYRLSHPERYKSPGLVESDGEEWYSLRSKLTPVLMKPQTIQKYISQQHSLAEYLVECIKSSRDVTNAVPKLDDLLFRYALESVCLLCLNKMTGCLNPNGELSPDAEILITTVHKLWKSFQEVYFGPPLWKYFPTLGYKRYAEAEDVIYRITSAMIDDVERGMENRDDSVTGLISDALLSVKDLDRRDVRTTMIDFIAAGIDNTANMIIFMLYLLAKNKDVQDKLRKELDEILGINHATISPQFLSDAVYLRAVLKETFRLMPTTPNLVRILPDEIVMHGYKIPPGVPISCQMYVACRLEKYFPQPQLFSPERWLSSSDHPPNRFASLPFGWGSRMCVGRRFAEQEILVTVAQLVRQFEISYPSTLETIHEFLIVPVHPTGFFMRDRRSKANMNAEKLKKLQGEVRIGGKGSARRKKKVVHRVNIVDDKKLQSTLKKVNCNPIPGIEEVNMFKNDGTVLHFNNPKVQLALSSNMVAVTGSAESKQLGDMLPKVFNQLGPEQLIKICNFSGPQSRSAPGADGDATTTADDENDIPNLVTDFEAASMYEQKTTKTEDASEEAVKKEETKPEEDAPVAAE